MKRVELIGEYTGWAIVDQEGALMVLDDDTEQASIYLSLDNAEKDRGPGERIARIRIMPEPK